MTEQQLIELQLWHRERMRECGYPIEIVKELVAARQRWEAGVRRIRAQTVSGDT
jgi:hypothetical protein